MHVMRSCQHRVMPSLPDLCVGSKMAPLKIPKPKQSSAWALSEEEFGPGVVGGKSGNLATLRGKLPADIAVPASVALPFGTFEKVLKDDVNSEAAAAVAKAQKALVRLGL